MGRVVQKPRGSLQPGACGSGTVAPAPTPRRSTRGVAASAGGTGPSERGRGGPGRTPGPHRLGRAGLGKGLRARPRRRLDSPLRPPRSAEQTRTIPMGNACGASADGGKRPDRHAHEPSTVNGSRTRAVCQAQACAASHRGPGHGHRRRPVTAPRQRPDTLTQPQSSAIAGPRTPCNRGEGGGPYIDIASTPVTRTQSPLSAAQAMAEPHSRSA